MSQTLNKFDNLLFEILQNEGQLVPFLDVIFNFLYRRTDFYKIQSESNINIGFPDSVAEQLLHQVFLKYYAKAREDDNRKAIVQESGATAPSSFVEIGNERKTVKAVRRKPAHSNGAQSQTGDQSDCYNGAQRGNYCWTQTITEVDVKVKVSAEVSTAKNVQVQIKPDHLSVSILEKQLGCGPTWTSILEGYLSQKIKSEESIWTFIPGEHVQVSLEKQEERWWECLMKGEPKVDIRKLDTSRPLQDLDEESQQAIQEMIFNQRQSLEGKPTTQDMKVQNILKDAWDKDGSPFQGQPFDPSIINVSNSGQFPELGN